MPIKLSFKKFPNSELRYIYLFIKSTDPDFQLIDRSLATLFINCQQVAYNTWAMTGPNLFTHFWEPKFLKTPTGPKRLFSIKSGPLFTATIARYTVYIPKPDITIHLRTDLEDLTNSIS